MAVAGLGFLATSATPVTATPSQAPPPLAWTAPKSITVDLASTNGESRVRGDGLDCAGPGGQHGQPVDDVHLLLTGSVPGGVVSSLPATVNANLGIAGLRLEPSSSNVSLGDERGTIRFQLDGGACPSAGNLAPSGDRLGGIGPLELVAGTGSYRDATLAGGNWALSAATAPGADNAWDLDLAGQLAVLAPGLQVHVVKTYWGNLGLDYVTRVLTVQYRITNPGPGDSYGSALTGIAPGAGVTNLGPISQPLGDLLAGESRVVTVRFQLALLGPPCQLLVLGCTFPTTLAVSLPDALDAPATRTAAVSITAPNLPPPL